MSEEQIVSADTSTPVAPTADMAPENAAPTTETEAATGTAELSDAQSAEQADDVDAGTGGSKNDEPKVNETKVELGELSALASESGLAIQGPPNGRERAADRLQVKKLHAELDAAINAEVEQIDRAVSEHRAALDLADTVRGILQADELTPAHLNQLAQTQGYASWDAMIDGYEEWRADPANKAVQILENRNRDIEQQRLREAEQNRQRAQQEARAAQEQRHAAMISEKIAGSNDGLCTALADFTPFVATTAMASLEHGHATIEELIDTPATMLQGRSPRAFWADIHRKLERAEAAMTAATQPVSKPKKSGPRAPGKTGVVRGAPVEAAGATEWADDKEFTKNWIRAMEEAVQRDNREHKPLGG